MSYANEADSLVNSVLLCFRFDLNRRSRKLDNWRLRPIYRRFCYAIKCLSDLRPLKNHCLSFNYFLASARHFMRSQRYQSGTGSFEATRHRGRKVDSEENI